MIKPKNQVNSEIDRYHQFQIPKAIAHLFFRPISTMYLMKGHFKVQSNNNSNIHSKVPQGELWGVYRVPRPYHYYAEVEKLFLKDPSLR